MNNPSVERDGQEMHVRQLCPGKASVNARMKDSSSMFFFVAMTEIDHSRGAAEKGKVFPVCGVCFYYDKTTKYLCQVSDGVVPANPELLACQFIHPLSGQQGCKHRVISRDELQLRKVVPLSGTGKGAVWLRNVAGVSLVARAR